MTLAFIGQIIDESRLHAVRAALRAAVRDGAVRYDGRAAGALSRTGPAPRDLGRSRARARPADRSAADGGRAARAASASTLGRTRRISPHLTLGRVRERRTAPCDDPAAGLQRYRARHDDGRAITLFESRLSPSRSRTVCTPIAARCRIERGRASHDDAGEASDVLADRARVSERVGAVRLPAVAAARHRSAARGQRQRGRVQRAADERRAPRGRGDVSRRGQGRAGRSAGAAADIDARRCRWPQVWHR